MNYSSGDVSRFRRWAGPIAFASIVMAGSCAVDANYNDGRMVNRVQGLMGMVDTETANGVDQLAAADPPVILLDPGHGGLPGKSLSRIDPISGLRDGDYPNPPEQQEVWQTSTMVQDVLKKAGYIVHLTKSSADDGAYIRDRANKAEEVDAD